MRKIQRLCLIRPGGEEGIEALPDRAWVEGTGSA